MRRVLAPGGHAAFIDVIAPDAPAKADSFLQAIELLRDPSHVRDYSLNEWFAALADAGFAVTNVVRSELDMDAEGWLARIGTDAASVAAINALTAAMPTTIRDAFVPRPGRLKLPIVYIEAAA